MKNFPKVCVMGLGYIGLPTASLLATKGFDVLGVDVSEHVVNTINSGKIHIEEPDLDILVKSAVNSGKLKASLVPEPADIFIIAVPTPFKGDFLPDLKYVEEATNAISLFIKKTNLVILESTCPTGTTETIAAILKNNGHDIENDVFVAHCPERVLPGKILFELVANDRIVGGINELSTQKAAEFYLTFVKGEVLTTDAKTAEMAKLTENSFRDVNIAFANEISMICDEHDLNPWELIKLANRHPRVNILNPGPGVGGHCIAVDPWFIIAKSPDNSRLIRTAREVNIKKTNWIIDKISVKASKFKNPRIACLGLAFKADVDDLRESPALLIAQQLQTLAVGEIIACEPNIDSHDGLQLQGLDDAIRGADIVVILVDHKQFKKLSLIDLKEKIVIDTRGILL
jgi:UDP-N-acetyl-D-mannosaminuronic acid dehydrogenase